MGLKLILAINNLGFIMNNEGGFILDKASPFNWLMHLLLLVSCYANFFLIFPKRPLISIIPVLIYITFWCWFMYRVKGTDFAREMVWLRVFVLISELSPLALIYF